MCVLLLLLTSYDGLGSFSLTKLKMTFFSYTQYFNKLFCFLILDSQNELHLLESTQCAKYKII